MAAKKKKASGADGPIVLRWNLDELPSAQHRAGLVGLMATVEWHGRLEGAVGICEPAETTPSTYALRVDHAGMQSLFDDLYAASTEEILVSQPYKGKDPKRSVQVEVTKKNAKGAEVTRLETRHVYETVVPRGAWLAEIEMADSEGRTPWIKLWRDFVWSILRGVPATRGPYEARAEGSSCADGGDAFDELQKNSEQPLDLPSTYALGAQARSADLVDVRDRARFRLLLHFWPLVARLYVPMAVDNDGQRKAVGYAVAVPDVNRLDSAAELFRAALLDRAPEVAGYRPREAQVDLPAEAGVQMLHALRQRLGVLMSDDERIANRVSGVEVIHCEKDGNNVRVRSIARVVPSDPLLDEYARVRGRYWSSLFKRQRLSNLLAQRPWWSGFERLCATESWKLTFDDHAFARDAMEAFSHVEVDMTDESGKSLESVVYQAIGNYVFGRLSAKYGLEWKSSASSEAGKGEFGEKKAKVARDAFLAVRARTGSDFVSYFTSTLCSVPQHLSEESYALLARELLTQPERVRALTLLALSARG